MPTILRPAVLVACIGLSLPAWANPPTAVPVLPPESAAKAAEAPVPQAPRASVAAIMVATSQALLWDDTRGEYVVVRAGDTFLEFQISSIDDEQVVLSRGNQHFVLPRTTDTSRLTMHRPRSGQASAPRARAGLVNPYAAEHVAPVAPTAPVDPYGVAPPAAPASPSSPVDPYGAAAPVTPTAPAGIEPMDPYQPQANRQPTSGNEGHPSGTSARPTDSLVLDPYAAGGMPLFASPPTSRGRQAPLSGLTLEPSPTTSELSRRETASGSTETGEVRQERHSLSRRAFDAALSDFHSLGRDVQVAQTPEGVRIVELAPSSLPYRMGLRVGDVVLDVDGQPLRSMDDAATVYARLMDVDRFTVRVARGADTVSLRYRFTR